VANALPRKRVRFQVLDVVHPDPVEVLLDLFKNLALEGEVVAETTDGAAEFVVVRIAGYDEPFIVPLDRTQPAQSVDRRRAPTGFPR
jgi:hypothetical protein